MKITLNKKAKSAIYLCITLSLGALLIIMINSTLVIGQSRKQVEKVVLNNLRKAQLLSDMRQIANERTTSLQNMLLVDDTISISEMQVQFNFLVGKYAKVWHDLNKMPLNHKEKQLVDELGNLISNNSQRQTEVAELIHNQKYDQAKYVLLHYVLPTKDRVFALTEQLSQIQERASHSAVKEARDIYTHMLVYLIVFTTFILFILIYAVTLVSKRLRKSENDIHYEKERSITALDSIADAVITTDAEGNIDQLNQSAMYLLGDTAEQAFGEPLQNYFKILTRSPHLLHDNPALQVIESNEALLIFEDTYLAVGASEEIAIELSVAPIVDRKKLIIGAVLVIKDISEMRALTNELAHQARHDSLTGLLNRREFENRLEQTISEVRRYPDEQAWFCYIDLDQFKLINDTCGHLAGDELLKQIAFKLISITRETDHVGRMGGDEFTIVLKRCEQETAYQIMERIRNEIYEMRFCWDDKCFTVSVSIGIVEVTPQCGNAYDVLKSADTACYIAKEAGRNRTHLFDEHDNISNQRRGEMEWVHRIYRAIETGQFVLFYQAIKHIGAKNSNQEASESMHGELLIRMLDDDGNIVSPYSFIPAAERYQLMPEIDRHVVHLALSTISRYYSNPTVRKGMFAINLSAQSLCDDEFLNFVLLQLASARISPHNLCFEITETAAISNLVKATHFITTLKEKGCFFSLDDFGSGLSSFAYLKNLPVDFIKIDGAFVKSMLNSEFDYALISSVNQIGHVVGMRTIAEFVENKQVEDKLISIGLDYAQGYSIGRPEPFNAMLDKTLARYEQTRTG